MAKQKTLSKLKKSEIFRFAGKKKVNIYQGKDRKYGFYYVSYNDCLSTGSYTKTDREVETDFDF